MGSNARQMSHDKSLLLFRVESFRFCVPATDVEAIIGMPAFRSIPNAPPSIQGVFSHRGQVATVINLRRKFGLQDHKDATDGQLILARISVGLTGFRVDEVLDITSSMEKDIIELTALKKSTRFDQVVILGDHIIQCTDFEQLYQAEDAAPRPGPSPPRDHLQEDAPPPAIEKDTHHPDGIPEQRGPAIPVNTNRNGRVLDESISREVSAPKIPETPPDRGKIAKATPFIPGTQSSSPMKASQHRSTRQFRPPTGSRQAAGEKPPGGIVSGKAVSQISQESTSMGENIGRASPGKRSVFSIAWMLPLAVVVLALYLLWPTSPEEPRRQPPPTVSDVSTAPEPEPAVSPADDAQLFAERFPSSPVTDTTDDDAGTLAVKTSAKPAEPSSPGPGEEIKADSEPLMNEATEVQEAVEAEEPETFNTPATTPAPREDASRFITIETEEFTLSVEPGLPETGEPAADAIETGTETPPSPSPAPLPKREYVHIVVKGDTLWDIAEKYLGDPFRYPQLAESSRIRDPDWIYPGDRVRIIIKSTLGTSQ